MNSLLPKKLQRLWYGLGVCTLLGSSGCCYRETSYSALYEQQSKILQGQLLNQADAASLAERFVQTFNLMGTPAFLPAADQLFSRHALYINDTLSVYKNHDQLQYHLIDMNRSVKAAKVELLDDWISNDSVYVHWRMSYRMSILGVQKEMMSYGISQLKMNSAGEIIFQQDYWDGNNGLYRQLPLVGWFYRWVLPFKGL